MFKRVNDLITDVADHDPGKSWNKKKPSNY